MKQCGRCGEIKPIDQFHRDRSRPDGRQPRCKVCQNAANKAVRDADPDLKAKQTRRWAQAHPEKRRERRRRGKRQHPEKNRARVAVGRAVKSGRLIKPKACEDCGEEVEIEAHHRDYSKPLEVEWLCEPCHRKQHRRESQHESNPAT